MQKKVDKKTKTILVIASIVFIIALLITLYPVIANIINIKHQSNVYSEYTDEIKEVKDETLEKAWQDAIAYNETLCGGLVTESFTKDALTKAAKSYDQQLNVMGNGIMGYIRIPSIKLTMPIKHGTDATTLDNAIGHQLGSSLPVGGGSAHCVLTGHSGMAAKKIFSDIDKLKKRQINDITGDIIKNGDVFYLDILGKTLAYEVDAINVVLPEDTSLLRIENGHDYVTLVTCTPYGVNTHRLLVRGTRIPYDEAKELEDHSEIHDLESTWQDQYIRGICVALIGLLPILLIIIIVCIKKISDRKTRENKRRKGGPRKT